MHRQASGRKIYRFVMNYEVAGNRFSMLKMAIKERNWQTCGELAEGFQISIETEVNRIAKVFHMSK